MRIFRVLLTICLGLFLVACTDIKQKNNGAASDEKVSGQGTGKEMLDPEQIFQIEMTSPIDEVLVYLKENIGITPNLQVQDELTIVQLEDIEAFDQTLNGVLTFKDDTTFMELFSMYDVYRAEYEEIRERYYREQHGFAELEEFYELPLKEREEIEHHLAEYVDKDPTWSRLKNKYEKIEEKYETDVLEYPEALYVKAEFAFDEPLNEKDREAVFDRLSKELGDVDETSGNPNLYIWENEKSIIIYDCTHPVKEDESLYKCMIFVTPNVTYMNDYLDLNIDF